MYGIGGYPIANPYPVAPTPQIQMPQAQVAQPVQTQGPQLLRVSGLDSVKMFQTVPNSTVALFDENDDVFYIKQTDSSNFPTIRTFKFTEVKEEKKEVPNVKYVTSDELDRVVNEQREEIQNGKQFIRTTATESTNSNASGQSTNGKYTKSNPAGKGND